ncbi:HAMP domain-containing histidine kinase [Sulfurimonas sp. SAG-AH-194-C20]|nr:HAMP domain-containing sensor histidine kinase [Sulfurimonas sp. SAG-AH-194-C20]MDF1878919.1 HAMP domain-containing histidine kinase [Sulfurimonas sp. SAG-AH-194-C20]
MKIKPFLLITYSFAGLGISLCTAIMTYIIIDEPIGFKMTSKISIVVLSMLPLIGIFSYFIGIYLSKKFEYISQRLDDIDTNKFSNSSYKDNIKDISNIHNSITHLSIRLQESILELQNNNDNLQTIIKSLSHDIKTPLTIIDGYLEELDDGLIAYDDIPKVTQILKKETAYLNELTSEVIGYIQSKEVTSSKKELILLKDFLHMEVCPLLRVDTNVELKCEVSDTESIVFNPIALKKILVNLLHNASKYTKVGYIKVIVKGENIMVEDTGIGIDTEFSRIIFEPFFAIDESRNRQKNGFGLGLSIADNLAKSNEYALKLDNSYTDGCRFILQKV